jgi:hypothetical protein
MPAVQAGPASDDDAIIMPTPEVRMSHRCFPLDDDGLTNIERNLARANERAETAERERDDLIARHGEISERMLLAEVRLAELTEEARRHVIEGVTVRLERLLDRQARETGAQKEENVHEFNMSGGLSGAPERHAHDASDPAGEALTARDVVARITECKMSPTRPGAIAFAMSGDAALALVERYAQQRVDVLCADAYATRDQRWAQAKEAKAQLATANAELAKLTELNKRLHIARDRYLADGDSRIAPLEAAITTLRAQLAAKPDVRLREAARELSDLVLDFGRGTRWSDLCPVADRVRAALAPTPTPTPAPAEGGEVGRERPRVAPELRRETLDDYEHALHRIRNTATDALREAGALKDTTTVTQEPRS